MSYIGKDISDNSEKMPSVLVSELLNYIQQSFRCVVNGSKDGGSSETPLITRLEKALLAALTHHYPMQSFSEQYFKGEHHTYQQNWWKALQADKNG